MELVISAHITKIQKAFATMQKLLSCFFLTRNATKQSLAVATRGNLAGLEVSLDFLIGKVPVEVDSELLKRIIDIQQMNTEDKDHILYTLDALIKAVKLKAIA